MTGYGGGDDDDALMSDINVTPLVDVVLVLLVIFMVTAPLLTHSMDVKLPEVSTSAPASAETIVIALTSDGRIAIDGKVATLEEAVTRVKAKGAGDSVFLRADEAVSYGNVVHVLDAFRKEGVLDVSLVVQQVTEATQRGGASR